jgi:hypothetical protein
MLQGRSVRSYDDAPAVLALENRPISSAAHPVLTAPHFASSTHARRWIFAGAELERMRAGCPLEASNRRAVECFAFETMKAVGAALEWHISIVLNAVAYARRFWLRRWACPRARLLPHNPRNLIAACLLVAAKVEGANEKKGRTRKEDVKLLLGRIIKALRDVDDIWVARENEVLKFETELLTTLRFELTVYHPHESLKSVMGALARSVAQTAWSLATELSSSDLIFLHAPSDLAHAALVAACAHHSSPVAVSLETSEAAGHAAFSAVVSWANGERIPRPRAAVEKPEESPGSGSGNSGDNAKQQQHVKHAIACLLQLAHGSSETATVFNRKRMHRLV